MADLRGYQPSFTAGELSPALWARIDLAKYASGLKRAVNVFLHPHGGVSNRAGLQFLGEVKDSAHNARLVPFQFNHEQSYILEFGNLYFRVWRNGGVVLDGLVPYEVVSPYAHGDLRDLAFIQDADVMYITHPLYPPQRLSRFADNNWTIASVAFAPQMSPPANLNITSYYQRTSGIGVATEFKVTSVKVTGEESEGSAAVSVAVTDPESGKVDGRRYLFSWTAVPGAALYRLYRTSGTPGFLVEVKRPSAELSETNVSGVEPQCPTSPDAGALSPPTGLTGVIAYGKQMSYKVAAVSAETGEESLPSAAETVENDLSYKGNRNVLFWDAVAGAGAYIVYRNDNGVFGYIGRSEDTTFTDDNIVADISDTPQVGRNPFQSAGNYPRCCTFIEQRLAFASTINDPQAVWMSQTANYQNFGYSSPAKPSDAVTFRIKSRQVNTIRSMIAVKGGLLLLTSGGEWVVSGGSQSDAITPSAIRIDNQGYRGAGRVQPLVVGNTVLFAQGRGGVVRDFSYQFTEDAFAGKDLTVLARHLFEGRDLQSWGYAQAPHSINWGVLSDGSLVSLTYMKEHEVWGWTRQQTADDLFEDIGVIAEGAEDVPYFLVRRTIGGQTKRYLERLHTRLFASIEDAFFVDSGLSYSGPPASIVTGLDHLNGEEVAVLADGNVVDGLTVGPVTGGVGVVLPNPASKVHVGLRMEAEIQTLNIDLGQVNGIGTVQARQKSIAKVTARVENTRGIFAGITESDLIEFKQRALEPWGTPINPTSRDVEIVLPWSWDNAGSMIIKQPNPLPMTILAAMPDIAFGR